MKKILLIGDMVGYGKIALSAIIPILSEMGMEVSNLPTALVSNTFDYKISAMLDTTSYMEETVEVWKKLRPQFDLILTGFLSSSKQVSLIDEIISFQEKKPLIITDPIMGDDGSLYHGLEEDTIDTMKEMIYLSDIILPNVTESQILAEKELKISPSQDDIYSYIKSISSKYNTSIVITSSELEDGNYIFSYTREDEKIIETLYDKVPYKFAGTGDLFAALVTGMLAKGLDLHQASIKSSSFISEILKMEIEDTAGEVRDVKIEKYLKLIGNL